MAWASVRLSVRHILALYKNGDTKNHEVFIVAVSRSLVFHDKILCPWVQRFPSNEGVKDSYPTKKWIFYRNYLV